MAKDSLVFGIAQLLFLVILSFLVNHIDGAFNWGMFLFVAFLVIGVGIVTYRSFKYLKKL